MNLPTNVRGDLPPETYRTSEFLLSSCENFKISLKPCTLEERFEVSSFIYMICETGSGPLFTTAPQFLQKLTPFFHFPQGIDM